MVDLVTFIDARLNDLENQHNTLALEVERLIKELIERVEDLEAKVPKVDEPAQKRDTSWHPHDAIENYWCPVLQTERVVVMTRAGYISAAERAEYRNWDERGDDTIVAWRYAKEGE